MLAGALDAFKGGRATSRGGRGRCRLLRYDYH